MQLIFDRRVTRRTPGTFRTRVLTEGVVPSLYAQYKHTKIKQYHKEGRALRTETTINDTYDFAIGRKLCNLPALREIGFTANRRLLDIQTLSHDASIGADRFHSVTRPTIQDGQRASALPFGEPRVLALLHALCLFVLLPAGFANADLRVLVAALQSARRLPIPTGLTLAPFDPCLRSQRLSRRRLVPPSHYMFSSVWTSTTVSHPTG